MSWVTDLDGFSFPDQTLGIVTFVGGVQPPQKQAVVFPIVDNNIALEFDTLTQLGLRHYDKLQEGSPFVMNVTVEDNDGKIKWDNTAF